MGERERDVCMVRLNSEENLPNSKLPLNTHTFPWWNYPTRPSRMEWWLTPGGDICSRKIDPGFLSRLQNSMVSKNLILTEEEQTYTERINLLIKHDSVNKDSFLCLFFNTNVGFQWPQKPEASVDTLHRHLSTQWCTTTHIQRMYSKSVLTCNPFVVFKEKGMIFSMLNKVCFCLKKIDREVYRECI